MDRRKKIMTLCLFAAVACLLLLALPALAQPAAAPAPAAGGGEGSTVSYFSRFFHTDNPLGTSLIWFCLIVSVGIVSLIINNLMTEYTRSKVYSPPALIESIEQMLADKQYKEAMEMTADDKSPFGQIMAASLHEARPRGLRGDGDGVTWRRRRTNSSTTAASATWCGWRSPAPPGR